MKTIKLTVLAVILGIIPCVLTAQDNEPMAPSPNVSHSDRGDHRGPHLLPPGADQKLNLTAEQKTKIAALEAEVKIKLEAVLTPDQLAQLAQMRPPRDLHGNPGQHAKPEGRSDSFPPQD